jgi:hypothetical protein
LLVHGRWFSPGIPASSTTKTGRHDIAETLLKVELNTINQIKSNPFGIALLIWIYYFPSNIDNVSNINKIVKNEFANEHLIFKIDFYDSILIQQLSKLWSH